MAAKQDAPTPVADNSIELTLHDFCLRLSESVKKPELIGAFSASQTRAGVVKDTEAAFRKAFDKFINAPAG